MLVLTLLVRDQADIVEATLAFHLNAGVDFVIATDHRSEDGSREILEGYERSGVLRLIRDDGEGFVSRTARTRMARMAADEYRADWVIGADADEFFWPRGGSLAEVLAVVPDRYGVVHAPWRVFVPRPEGDAFFAERMTVRLSPSARFAHPRSPYKPEVKIAHRGQADVVVQGGNHRLLSPGLDPAPWHPIETLHFPIRSPLQLERKMADWSKAGRAWAPERTGVSDADSWFDSVVVSDDVVAVGVQRGSLVLDTRLRDALRPLRAQPGDGTREFLVEPDAVPIRFDSRLAIDDVGAYRAVVAGLADRSLHTLQRRLDDVAERIDRLESPGIGTGVG